MGLWYRTGTASVTNGSAAVVGVDTLWETQAAVGDIFVGPDGDDYEITVITDDTHMSVKQKNGTASYAGATLAGQAYAIIRNFTSTLPAQLASQLAALMTQYHVTLDELTAWLSGTGTVTVHDSVGTPYSVETPAAMNATLSGALSKSVAGGVDVNLTSAEASNLFITFTGAITADINVVMPAGVRHNFIHNDTTGAHTLTVKTAAGTGVAVVQGKRALLECDGTNVVSGVNSLNSLELATTLSVLGIATFADGTVGAPGISFGADTDSGIYRIGANEIGVAVNGAKVLDIATTGLGVTGVLSVTGNTTLASVDIGGASTFTGQVNINNNAILANAKQLLWKNAGGSGTPGGFQLNASDSLDVISGGSVVANFSAAGHFSVNGAAGGSTVSIKATGIEGVFDLQASASTLLYTGAGTLTYSGGESSAASTLFIRRESVQNRSISASGTINASGADYAEYERKASLITTFAKGEIVGFDANGQLVPPAIAVSFGVKSSSPSYVGGDCWGGEAQVGVRPQYPPRLEEDTDESFAVRLSQYESALAAFEATLEAARQEVDRIAYSGKVPVNVTGAAPGNLIVADNGGEAWDLVSDATVPDWFKKYLRSIGRVRRVLPDGRAQIAVYVH